MKTKKTVGTFMASAFLALAALLSLGTPAQAKNLQDLQSSVLGAESFTLRTSTSDSIAMRLTYTGSATEAVLDITTTTSCSTGTTPTTTGADQLLIAGVGLNGTSDGWANTWTNSFSQQSTVVSTGGSAVNRSASSTADRIVTATGTYETTESWTTSRNCQAAIVTFTAL
ncbi:MAG: hypothetical protein IH943_11155 [Acidobacteria bacterium]|nr:hypothetical protein [Acidobacteriota bacterium]